MKRYRRPKVVEGQIKMQRGKLPHEDPDMYIFYGDDTPRCDRALVINTFCFGVYDVAKNKLNPSFIEELELRGYDLETLRFSIERLTKDNQRG